MKLHSLQSTTLALLTTLAMSTGALAAGTHAGGHGADEMTIGKPGVAARVSRTLHVDMTDNMRFTPADIPVRKGETIRFVVKNSGQVPHEFMPGDEKETRRALCADGKISGHGT